MDSLHNNSSKKRTSTVLSSDVRKSAKRYQAFSLESSTPSNSKHLSRKPEVSTGSDDDRTTTSEKLILGSNQSFVGNRSRGIKAERADKTISMISQLHAFKLWQVNH